MFQFRAVCSLIVVALISHSQPLDDDMLASPCPGVFKYVIQVENHQPLAKRWYGFVNLSTNVTLHSLWLNIILDGKADILGSWIGEVTTRDNSAFMIENQDITILPNQNRTACFFVQYSSDFKPKLKTIFLNGRELCKASKTEAKIADQNSLTDHNENNKTRVKSAERSETDRIIKHIYNKSQPYKKIRQTTTSKPNYFTQTTPKRAQTTLGTIKNINPAHVSPESKIQLLYLKKSNNNQQATFEKVGNSTCLSCHSELNDGSIKGHNILKGPTVSIQQGDNKNKNYQHLQIYNNRRFDNLQTAENAYITTDISTSTKVKGDDRSNPDNNRRFDNLQRVENAYITTHISTSRKVIGDDRTNTDNNRRFESMQTAENATPTTDISAFASTSRKRQGDDSVKTDNVRRFDNFQTAENASITTDISTSTKVKVKGDDRSNTDINRRFDNLQTAENAYITPHISTSRKVKGDDRSNPDNNRRFDNLQGVENAYITTHISTSRKVKGDDRTNTDNNRSFESLQTAENAYITTDISTSRKVKGDDRSNTDNNRRFESMQTAENATTTTDISAFASTSRKRQGDDSVKTDNVRRFDNFQTAENASITTDISTSTKVKVKGDDRPNTDINRRFDNLQTAENAYITTHISTSLNVKGDDSVKTDYYNDYEVIKKTDILDMVAEIGVQETLGRPQIDTTSGTTPWSHRHTEIRDIFREPILDNPNEESNGFKDEHWIGTPQSPAVAEVEEEEIHPESGLPVFHPNFNQEPSCGQVIKTQPWQLPYGSTTSEGQWPWQVAIYQQRTVDLKYICGGTLVSQRHVITAAHCITKKKSNSIVHKKTVTIYLGKFNLRLSVEGVQVKFVSGIIVHPEYNSTTFSRNLAILELRSPVALTDWVRPICLWPEDEISPSNIIGKTGSVVGWSFEDSVLTNAELRLTEMPVVDHETCINSFESVYNTLVSDRTYCARYKTGTETCTGNDSGGGMVFKKGNSWYLRGLVSVSISFQNENRCDSKHFIIFTDIAQFLPWIRDFVDL